jgi:hypothetical protein
MGLYAREEVNLFIEARIILALTSFVTATGFVVFYVLKTRGKKNSENRIDNPSAE